MGRMLLALTTAFLMTIGIAAAAEPPGDVAGRINALEEKTGQMAAGKPGEYARDLLDAARASLLAAQSAFTSGNDRGAMQKLELADMQLTVAEAKSAEKELAEDTALRRAELKKLEAQLERYFQGEE